MKYRHELKYLINEGDAALLRERLQVVLQPDPHARNGSYSIRSLYFDDYWASAYNEKNAGVSDRKKYRIRLYDLDDSFMRLECKHKKGAYIRKVSAPISREESEQILRGDYGFLLRRPEELCRQFYCECISNVMRPMVYVDYEREPYILPAGDVRVTFDRNVRGAYPYGSLAQDNKIFHHVLEPGKLVLEVKFTEFLPNVVRELLPMRAAEYTAVSKYTLCCEQVGFMSGRITD